MATVKSRMGLLDPIPTQASSTPARLTRAEVQALARLSHHNGSNGSVNAKTQPQGHGSDRSGARRSTVVLSIVLVVLVGLLLAYISLSDGIDYLHGFGRACLIAHDGWHFHVRCDSVSRPNP